MEVERQIHFQWAGAPECSVTSAKCYLMQSSSGLTVALKASYRTLRQETLAGVARGQCYKEGRRQQLAVE